MLSFAVIASSSESVCEASRVRRKAFSTSAFVIGLLSTVAHVSGDGGATAAGVERQEARPAAAARSAVRATRVMREGRDSDMGFIVIRQRARALVRSRTHPTPDAELECPKT